MSENKSKEHLYRFEFIDDDELPTIQWVWLKPEEVDQYWSSLNGPVICRQATQDEEDLYEEAYADGYGIAAFLEFESKNDGVTFRVELGEDGELDASHKMFQCALCKIHKDFDDAVAHVNGFYLTQLVDETLWHVCYDCISISLSVGDLGLEYPEEN